MNLTNKLTVLILALFLLTSTMVSAKGGARKGVNNNQLATTSLTDIQKETLLWMREEEKLARDVYLTLYKKWKKPEFSNIASSEQKHMDALLKKVELFGMSDPVLPGVGDFFDVDLQDLHDKLIDDGRESYIDALWVGATIEDMDMRDLRAAIDETDNLALKTTYESLLEGSKNHLRTYVGLLQQQGEEYIPQYIEPELFDAILGL